MAKETFAKELRGRMTPAELYLWSFLKSRKLCGVKFRRQAPIGRFFVDFYCAEKRLAIELDGGFHDNRALEDAARQTEIGELGIKIIRFRNEEV